MFIVTSPGGPAPFFPRLLRCFTVFQGFRQPLNLLRSSPSVSVVGYVRLSLILTPQSSGA